MISAILAASLLAAAPAAAFSLTPNNGGIFGPTTQVTPMVGPAPGVPVPPAWLGVGSLIYCSRQIRRRIRDAQR